ncbi:MAG TPA: hypothetical protein V6C72_17200, partial [Chroococcales cyanobacterium]
MRLKNLIGASSAALFLIGGAGLVSAGLVAAGLVAAAQAYDSPAFDRGTAEMSRGDFDGAIMSFGEAIGFDANNKSAYSKRGQCFFHLKN